MKAQIAELANSSNTRQLDFLQSQHIQLEEDGIFITLNNDLEDDDLSMFGGDMNINSEDEHDTNIKINNVVVEDNDTFYNIDVITPIVQDSYQTLIGDPFETALKFQAEEEGDDGGICLFIDVVIQDDLMAPVKVRSEDKPPPHACERLMVWYQNLDEQLAVINIDEEENGDFIFDGDVEEQVNRYELCLVRRFLTEKNINVWTMTSKMADIWKPMMGINIKETDPGIFLFQFYHQEDLLWVFNGGPWSFDSAMLVLNKIPLGEEPLNVSLWFLEVWIQIHDLPKGFMAEVVGRQLGDFFGEFLQYDVKNNSSIWMEYMRIKIKLDVRKPLKRRKKIKRKNGTEFVVTCKYERLGDFCFICGLVSHTERFCRRNLDKRSEEGVKDWGPWLRATPRRGLNQGRSKWLRDEDDAEWEAKIGRSNNCPPFTGGNFGDMDNNLTVVHDSSMRANLGKDKVVLGKEMGGTNSNSMLCIQEINFGPNLEEEIGLDVEDRKRRRSGPITQIVMDTDDILNGANNKSMLLLEAGLSGSDCSLIFIQSWDSQITLQLTELAKVGGLAIMWKHSVICKVVDSSVNYIDVVFFEKNSPEWRLSCFYGMPEHKEGVHPHSQSLMDGFRSAIEDCNLVEVDLMGGKYTWEKSKGKPNWVKERLDRAFATEGWWQKFPLGTLELRHAIVSDHEPIELKLMDTLMSRKHFRFRFENSWLKEPSLKLKLKLISVSSFMSKWGRNFYHKFRDKVKRQKEILNALKDREDEEGIKSYFEEREKLNEFLEHEESYWKQRAKIFWLKEGDTNSRFFHVQASKRKKCNRTMGGKWILMTRCAGDSTETPVITEEQNRILTAEVGFEEFTCALKQMHPDKASGPDDLNSINLVLIPKKENVDNLKDVRPIALYNVLYKILAKVLANRLKKVLPVVITENQSAFVQGRSITDNVLISFELIHFMKRKKGSQDGEVALKLDISKAYDRVSWDYLWHRMRIMGFNEKWLKWMRLYVTTVQYMVCLNGSYVGPIMPSRGLRQGDPLSPYLFLLCAEGLSNLLNSAAATGSINGCRISSTVEETRVVKDMLNLYEKQSGQAVNFQKSAMFFSSNVRRDNQTEIWSLSNEIEKMFNGFWWKSGKNGGKGIRWHAWDKMCTAKNKGGLGFRCMYGYNLALLGKHVWNFLKNPESLVARIFKARYFPDKYVLEAQKGSNASFIWSGICAAKDEFYRGFKWVLGDGLNIDIFTDQWLRGKSYYKVDTDHTHNTRIDKVCEFFRPYGKQWDEAKVTQTFHDGDARCILNTRIPQNQIQDRVAWLHTKDGQYSLRINSCLVRLARTLWGIWFARNRKVWEDKQTPPNVAMEVASKMVDEWQKAQQKNQLSSNTPNRSENESQVHWEKPQGGWKKVNVDASVYDGSSSFKIGLVLRDDSGSFIAGLQSCMAGQVSSMEAEVIDVHEALCSIQSLGLGNIAVECDALNVVSAVQKGTVYFLRLGVF
ncbi:uncharacterized protein LOC141718222 [Apium graveolens]|uniref:uncharacterized protein LOC141718222 n=1 Tax=Apium graveolens TaxID=4045 RepID=UPI003D78EB3D